MEGCDRDLDTRSILVNRRIPELHNGMWIFGVLQFKGENEADLKMWLLEPGLARIILFSDSHGCNQGVYHYPNVDLKKGINDFGNFTDNEGVNLIMSLCKVQVSEDQGYLGCVKDINIYELNSAIGWYGSINFKLRNLDLDLETDPLLTQELGGGEIYFFREPVLQDFQGDKYWYAEKDDPKYGVPSRVWGKEEGGVYQINPLVYD